MKTPPVFFDPSRRRWQRFMRILALLLVLGMTMICALAVSVLRVPLSSVQDALLPQSVIHAGPQIAPPGGSLQQQLQQAVAALNTYVPTPSASQPAGQPPVQPTS